MNNWYIYINHCEFLPYVLQVAPQLFDLHRTQNPPPPQMQMQIPCRLSFYGNSETKNKSKKHFPPSTGRSRNFLCLVWFAFTSSSTRKAQSARDKPSTDSEQLTAYHLVWSHFVGGDSHEYVIHLCLTCRFLACHSFHPNNPERSILLSFNEWIVKRDVVYFAVCGTVPGSRKFSVDKVWGAAATVGQGGNFFVPAARVISSSLNYASAEVSSSVRIRQVQREGIEESCHTKLIKPRNTSSQSRHIGRPRIRPSVEQRSNTEIFLWYNLHDRKDKMF